MASLADMIRQNKMRPIDQNPLLGKVSSVLGSAREYGNKVNLPVFGGLGDMFVGKAPEEVENWSYGNSPFQSTEMGLPQIKRERKQSLVDALSTLAGPVSGLAKATEGLPVGMSIKDVAKNLSDYDFDNILFNGSSSPIHQILPRNELEKKGIYTLFDGIFSHPDMDVAASHGNIINRFVPRKNAIAQGSLDWNHEYDDILKEIKHMYPHASDADIEEVLYPAIVDDKNIWGMDEDLVSSATGKYDMADASWDMQNSRGKLAHKLGYDAVEMNDEHGTSYLIPHGSKALIVDKNLNPIENQPSLTDLLGKK